MSQFMTDLFASIFTPGPTPTLIIATNATFAALQLLFLLLLLSTYSIHFVILSCLSGGLWWAINWFVAEVRLHQAAEQQKQQAEQEARGKDDHVTDSSDTDAETVIDANQTPATHLEVASRSAVAGLREREQTSRRKSGASTEDEWEKVSESEKDK